MSLSLSCVMGQRVLGLFTLTHSSCGLVVPVMFYKAVQVIWIFGAMFIFLFCLFSFSDPEM